MELNRARIPLSFEYVPRRQRELHRLTQLSAGANTVERAQTRTKDITETAARLAMRFQRVENLLISHEGLQGVMPGREMPLGLYPFAHVVIPAMVKGFEHAGVEVKLVFYTRDFADWQTSLFRYRFRAEPGREYFPQNFAKRTGLPRDWDGLIYRLTAALPAGCLRVISYEEDRESGLLGRELYRAIGLTEPQVASLRRPPAQNVSRAETHHDAEYQAD